MEVEIDCDREKTIIKNCRINGISAISSYLFIEQIVSMVLLITSIWYINFVGFQAIKA